MLGNGSHGIVAYPSRNGTSYPGWVGEEGVEPAVTAIVEIDIYASIVGEYKVADRVCALDVEGVFIVGIEKPDIFFLYERASLFIRPELFRVTVSF